MLYAVTRTMPSGSGQAEVFRGMMGSGLLTLLPGMDWLAALSPQVSVPHHVDNVVDATELAEVKVDAVFVGTCTNGRLEDLHAVADILSGRKVASGVRLLIVPASSEVLRAAVARRKRRSPP